MAGRRRRRDCCKSVRSVRPKSLMITRHDTREFVGLARTFVLMRYSLRRVRVVTVLFLDVSAAFVRNQC